MQKTVKSAKNNWPEFKKNDEVVVKEPFTNKDGLKNTNNFVNFDEDC